MKTDRAQETQGERCSPSELLSENERSRREPLGLDEDRLVRQLLMAVRLCDMDALDCVMHPLIPRPGDTRPADIQSV